MREEIEKIVGHDAWCQLAEYLEGECNCSKPRRVKEIEELFITIVKESKPEKTDVSNLVHNPLLRQKYQFNLGYNGAVDEYEKRLLEAIKSE